MTYIPTLLYTGLNQRNGILKINREGELTKPKDIPISGSYQNASLYCAPYTSGFFYIKTNFFNKRSFTRVAQSTKVHFHNRIGECHPSFKTPPRIRGYA